MSASSRRREMRKVLSVHSLMTLPEVAAVLGCSDPTLRKMVRAGTLPTVTVGGLEKMDPVDLFAYMVADKAGKTVAEYREDHGDEALSHEANRLYSRVRRFVA